MPTTSFEYDKLGRLTKKWNSLSGAVYYAYDASGKRTSLKDPDLKESVYVHDAAGRLSKLEVGAGRTAYFGYDASGLMTRRVFPGGPSTGFIHAYYLWDEAGRLAQLENRGPTYGDLINYFSYERDQVGAITRIRHKGEQFTYWSYDELNRLTRELRVNPFGSVIDSSYGYDAASNRTLEVDEVAGEVSYYSLDSLNQITQVWEKVGDSTTYFNYDSSQRMTGSLVPGGESAYFTHDQQDRITELSFAAASSPDSTRLFSYSGVGERIRLKVGTGSFTETYMTYDGGKLLREASDGGDVLKTYRHNMGPDMGVLGSLVEIQDGTDFGYPAMDQRGTVAEILKGGAGSSESNQRILLHDAFGNVVSDVGFFMNDQRLRFLSPALVSLDTEQPMQWDSAGLYQPAFGPSSGLAAVTLRHIRGIPTPEFLACCPPPPPDDCEADLPIVYASGSWVAEWDRQGKPRARGSTLADLDQHLGTPNATDLITDLWQKSGWQGPVPTRPGPQAAGVFLDSNGKRQYQIGWVYLIEFPFRGSCTISVEEDRLFLAKGYDRYVERRMRTDWGPLDGGFTPVPSSGIRQEGSLGTSPLLVETTRPGDPNFPKAFLFGDIPGRKPAAPLSDLGASALDLVQLARVTDKFNTKRVHSWASVSGRFVFSPPGASGDGTSVTWEVGGESDPAPPRVRAGDARSIGDPTAREREDNDPFRRR